VQNNQEEWAVFNVVASCDNAFAQHACVMLTSLLFHHQNQSQLFRIFLLVPSSFSQENRKNIIKSLSPWGPELEFVSVGERELSGLKVGGHISSATYYRLCVSELLPHNVKTALYLDSDIIINGSLLDLFNTDISEHGLAAVPDAWVDKNEAIRSKILLNEEAHYLNGGVLLLNLERWRTEKIGLRVLKFCRSNPDRITFWDQCGINHFVQGRFYVLDRKWNFQQEHMRRVSKYKFHPSAEEDASSAAIIHFTSNQKPWSFMCTHPMKELYFKYLKYTAWSGFTERDRTLRNVVKRYLGVHFPSASRRTEAAYSLGKRLLGASPM
jgi:lipopolysaccharide biosynthesis glycosyltransferase